MAVVGAVIVTNLKKEIGKERGPQLTHGCTVGKLAVCWFVLALGDILLSGKIKLSILGKYGFKDFVPRSGTHLTSLSLKGVMYTSLGIASEHLTVRSRPWSYAEVALSGGFQTPELLRANRDWRYPSPEPPIGLIQWRLSSRMCSPALERGSSRGPCLGQEGMAPPVPTSLGVGSS